MRIPKLPRGVLSLMAAVVALWAGIGFLVLAANVREGDTDRFDLAVLGWVAEIRRPELDEVFIAITQLGSAPVMAIFTLAFCGGALLVRRVRAATWMLVAMLGVPLITVASKAIVGRRRPSVMPHLETVTSESFPSGHTVASLTFFVTLAFVLGRHARETRLKVVMVVASFLLGLLVAASRVYLGVHYPSDVAGGGLLAIAWCLTLSAGEALLLPERRRRST